MNVRRIVVLSVSLLVAAVHPAAAQDVLQPLAAMSGAFQALAAKVNPSVVQILSTDRDLPATRDTPAALLGQERGSGSGVIIDPAGYILTNSHVVEGAHRLQVQLARPALGAAAPERARTRLLDAAIVGVDEETDVAVLKVEEANLPALPLGNSDRLQQGQMVFAFGSPMGLENSVTMGVVSAVGRQLEYDDPMVYIQTDAPINPGNSGGPLVDVEGRVVGINTLILSQSGGNEGLGFAAPINIVRPVFEQLRAGGVVRRGTIGVNPQTITPTLAQGLSLAQDWGVVLADVYPEGTGAAAGLKVGDVVLALDGATIGNGHQFDVSLYRRRVGDTVRLDVLRGRERLAIAVPVAERDDDPARFADLVTTARNLVPRLGVLAMDLTAPVRNRLDRLRVDDGVLVAARVPAAPGTVSGPDPGDVIVALNGAPIRDLTTLRARVAALPRRAPCVLQVQRGADLRYLAFELN